MTVRLTHNNYGKSRVRVMKIIRHVDRHELIDLTVSVSFEGNFEKVHTIGDNSCVLATDTMKNMVYALAHEFAIHSIEAFALHLGEQLLQACPAATTAHVHIAQADWQRNESHNFVKGSEERQTCSITLKRDDNPMIESGLEGMIILKTAQSAFAGYIQDRFTTLKETTDRLLGTSLAAEWRFVPAIGSDFNQCRQIIRDALVNAFAQHESRSVQHTLYAMGQRALDECNAIDRISLSMPNKHCLLVDLSPFGLENNNEIFMPIDEPHGLIEATLER